VKRSSDIEVTALQATVRQLQGDLDDSSKRFSEQQLVEVRYRHSLSYHISLYISLFVYLLLLLRWQFSANITLS
jgi:hypothetical protein